MAARRNRRSRRRNGGRFGFLYKLLSALLIFAAILVGCVVFFRVDQILVTGQSKYTQAQIVEASGVQRGDNLFRLNKFQLIRQVRTALPYVDEMSISRRPPDTLILAVTECVPVAMVQGDGAWWLLDAKCKVLERGEGEPVWQWAEVLGIAPLAPAVGAVLAVDEPQRQKLQSLKELLSALVDEGMTGSVRDFIDLTSDSRVRFSYGEDLTVVLPLVTNFKSQIYALKRTLQKMDESGIVRTGTLDFTIYTGERQGVSLLPDRWMPGDDGPAAAAEPTPADRPNDVQGVADETKKAQ